MKFDLDSLATQVVGASTAKATLAVPGATLDILDEGPRSGRIVLLAHALMASQHMWDATVKTLHTAGYRTIRYNQPGHGGSAPPAPDTRFHFDDLANHMGAVLQQQTGAPTAYAIVGCAMGGVLALRFAMLFPGAVERIVCCDAPGLASLADSKPVWEARVAQFRSDGVDVLAQDTVERWFPPPCAEEPKAAALAMNKACSLEGYAVCAAGIADYDYDAELSKVAVKTMVLVGDNDTSIGGHEVLEEVARKVPDAKYVRLQDCGHIPPMHRPKEFETALLEFL